MGFDWLKERARGQAVRGFDAALPPDQPLQADEEAEGLSAADRAKALALCEQAEEVVLAGGGDLSGYFIKLAITELRRADEPASKELPMALPRGRGYTYR